ncbi:hypothetical protein UFOVP237_41 [uncultured Caudovirales phage]|uniref:Uncharacterized protein n=1 Tax=uncultured Caudovirales phage TaxID=2100421 RepID=A0A6J7WPX9_9CAUD|nr:hypothetical protein UFOVP237_41 [uncultured Caudovirales phage]
MQSEVRIGPSGASFNGPDGTRLFQAITIRSALKLHKAGLRVNRHTTTTMLFKFASSYTQKVYKRGEFDRAMQDLTVWIDAMRAAIPVTVEAGHQADSPISVNGMKVF